MLQSWRPIIGGSGVRSLLLLLLLKLLLLLLQLLLLRG